MGRQNKMHYLHVTRIWSAIIRGVVVAIKFSTASMTVSTASEHKVRTEGDSLSQGF